MRSLLPIGLSSLLLVTVAAAPVLAQQSAGAPAPGARASGLGGAFTGLADDASAVFWNPAGLASGGFFSLVLDHSSRDDGAATMLALSTPPLGLSYYRTDTGPAGEGRNSLVTHNAGVTFVQSLADRIAVGATLKAVHGEARAAGGGPVSSNKVDLDVGVMATGSLGRIGFAIHNLTEPSFETTAERLTLERRFRGGISLNTGRKTTVSGDFDFNTTHDVATGEPWREAAIGGEFQPARKAWLRAGIHWNTAGDRAATAGSVGGSYAIYGATMADAYASFGADDRTKGWGLGLRFVF
jgi:hypothetical protein